MMKTPVVAVEIGPAPREAAMIRDSDIHWWILEAKKHPESAPDIIKQLASRLVQLDAENERLRAELLIAQAELHPGTASELTEARRQIADLRRLLAEHRALEPSIVVVTRTGQIARFALSRLARLAHGGTIPLGRRTLTQVWGLLLTQPHERLILVAANGTGRESPVQRLPALEEDGSPPASERDASAPDDLFGPNNPVTAATVVGQVPRLWTVVTRRGWTRQYLGAAFARDLVERRPLGISPMGRDVPVALVSGDPHELIVVTRWGLAARFPQRAIAAQGNPALTLEADDEVIAALPLAAEGEIVLVTAGGAAMRRSTAALKPRSRPGGAGQPLIQALDLLAVLPSVPHANLVLLTHFGRLHAHPVDAIPFHDRVGKGAPLGDLARDPAIAALLVPHVAET